MAMKELANGTLRNEFQKHKAASTEHLIPFFREWNKYESLLRDQLGSKAGLGSILDIDHLSNEQVGQLYELYKELKK